MHFNRRYRKLHRAYIRKSASGKKKAPLWLDRKSERHIRIIAAMFFAGFFLIVAYGYSTLLSWSQISQMYFGWAVALSFIPQKWLPVIYKIRKELKVLLGVCALAPVLTALVLILNFYIPVEKTQRAYKVVNYNFNYREHVLWVELNDFAMNRYSEIRKFPLDEFRFEPDSAYYNLQRGCFGMWTVHESWLIPKNNE